MFRRRTIGLALALAIAGSGIAIGASALAASPGKPTNNRAQAGGQPGARAVGAPQVAPSSSSPTVVLGYLSLAASAFAPDGLDDTSEDYFNHWDPSTLSNQDSQRCFDAGLTLPSNATIKSATFYYTEGTSSVMYGEINRQDLVNHTATTLA